MLAVFSLSFSLGDKQGRGSGKVRVLYRDQAKPAVANSSGRLWTLIVADHGCRAERPRKPHYRRLAAVARFSVRVGNDRRLAEARRGKPTVRSSRGDQQHAGA